MAHNLLTVSFRFCRMPVVWSVSNGQFHGVAERDDPNARLRDLDGWFERDKFFGITEGSIDALTKFLNGVGAWPSSDSPSPNEPGHAMGFPLIVRPADIWEFRSDLKHALQSKAHFKRLVAPPRPGPRSWLDLFSGSAANHFGLRFELSGTAQGVVDITNARQMMFATVLSDVARGIRFKTCRRRDCARPFPIESKHTRFYCSQYCGHLDAQRRKRKADHRSRWNGA